MSYRNLEEDGFPVPSAASSAAPPPRSLGYDGKRNDGTDSNFMDYQKNNGGELYASQKILLSIIAIAGLCGLLRWWRGRD